MIREKTILDRLAFWGCELQRLVDSTERDPIGRPAGPWDISGTEYYLEDYIYALDPEASIYNARNVMEAVNKMHPSDFDLTHDAIETRLDWRGYGHSRDAGWAVDVKLHDVWKYMQKWGPLNDLIEDADLTSHDWSHVIESEWDSFLETVPDVLDPKLFTLRGAQGGWLLYTRPELTLEEAETLYVLYQRIPKMVDYVCQRVATDSMAYALAELWDADVDEIDWDSFTLDGVTFSVKYG